MSLDNITSEHERSKLAVWDYPVSDKFLKMWTNMQEILYTDMDHALDRVRKTKKVKGNEEGFALIADATDVRL